ncbi:zinc finger protein 333-like [Sabethes cyaneus]|uniref:zinc finger protein 333-like n=1 Tax=Sabethes cyaneus TaxID=53552 RepID=UPI00237DDFD7|nr:zinc finger protein 333-like [Sabethes cyaneus]XP_053691168.1 zinc finger protein 333-like [Sabethes cyaneus]
MDVGQEFEFGSSTASSPTLDELLNCNFESVPSEIESTKLESIKSWLLQDTGSSTASSPTLDELLNCNFESVPSEIESTKLESIKSWLLQDTGSSTASSPTLDELLNCNFESVPSEIESINLESIKSWLLQDTSNFPSSFPSLEDNTIIQDTEAVTISTSVAPVFPDNGDLNNNCAAVQQLTSSSSGSYFQPAESSYSGYNIISQPNEQPVVTTEAQVLESVLASVKLVSPQEEAITAQPVFAANNSTQLAGCSSTKRRKRNNAKIDYDTIFYCKECDQKFGRVGSWRQHNNSQHSELPFECTKCGKRFGTQTQLTVHKLNHTAAKQKFACDYPHCTRRYVHRKDLQRHKQSHEGSYEFICDLCGYGSARKDHILKHRLTVHRNGKVPPKVPKKGAAQ